MTPCLWCVFSVATSTRSCWLLSHVLHFLGKVAEVHNITSQIEGSNLDGIHDKDKYRGTAGFVSFCKVKLPLKL